jgi:UTP--glucose-1-phosphate uridylyltransferase
VIGRYVFTPDIFDALEQIQPGAGGELQLTDAIALLAQRQPVYGCVFQHGRYDIGRKIDFLRANIELSLEHPNLGPELGELLADLVRRRNLS